MHLKKTEEYLPSRIREKERENVSPQLEDVEWQVDPGVENGRVERHHGVESTDKET